MTQPPVHPSMPYASPPWPPPPGVLTWFKVYAIGMAILYVLVAVAGVVLLAASDRIASDPAEETGVRIQGIVMAALGLPFAAAFGAAPLLPRRTWVWVYDLVLIAVGLTSCCLWPATIPLLIFWIKTETRDFFTQPPTS